MVLRWLFAIFEYIIGDKYQMELGTLIIVTASFPFIYFMFAGVNARPEYFVLGIGLCVMIEANLLLFYCFYKLQKTYRDSKTINFKNSKLNPEVDYPFTKYQQVDKFYYNKYSEEARLNARKKALKMTENDNINEYFGTEQEIEETQVDGQTRNSIMSFLKEIRGYYNTLNRFNNSLVYFGKNMKNIQETGILSHHKYFFAAFENNYPSEVTLNELIDEQKEILYKTRTKLKIRKDNQRLLFPTWDMVVTQLKFIGEEFQKIEIMRQSNSEMIQMIHKKVQEQYEFLEDKIVELKKNLQGTKQNKYKLNKDYRKYQAEQINENNSNEPHGEMKYWVRKKIYQFKDLQRRIRENQKDQVTYVRKLKYYKEKMSSFSEQNKRKYLKILKTRFIAFLDSYYITVDQSIKKIQAIFTINHVFTSSKPPKVNKLKVTKNINETLENERVYQEEYFERVKFYQVKLEGLMKSLESITEFIEKMQKIWGVMIENLRICEKNQEKTMKYFAKLFRYMIDKSENLQKQITQLKNINTTMKNANLSQLTHLKSKIDSKLKISSQILTNLVIEDSPIQYRYQSAKVQLELHYKDLEDIIEKIKEFEGLYIIHSSRLKKILLVEIINYLNFQKVSLNFGQINEKNLSDGDYDMIDENAFPEEFNEQNNEILGEQTIQKIYNIQTGFGLSGQHIKLLNQFLFSAYTQWKKSDCFQKIIAQELFIIFNSEPNQNFSNVEVDSVSLSGTPPEIISIKELRSEEHELFVDVKLAFKGKFELNMKTLLKIFRSNWNVSIKANFEAFYCVMRLCFVPTKLGRGKSWFSFIGEPIAKIDISLKIMDFSFEQEPVKNLFANFLNNKMKKFIYPVKQSINIPISLKNEQLLKIKRRLMLSQQERDM